MSSWIEEELSSAQFNDKRLNDRFVKIAIDLADNPSELINSASLDWAASKAAYRFFDNPEVDSQKILAPHYCRSRDLVYTLYRGHHLHIISSNGSSIGSTLVPFSSKYPKS
jgi:hypothetical protein